MTIENNIMRAISFITEISKAITENELRRWTSTSLIGTYEKSTTFQFTHQITLSTIHRCRFGLGSIISVNQDCESYLSYPRQLPQFRSLYLHEPAHIKNLRVFPTNLALFIQREKLMNSLYHGSLIRPCPGNMFVLPQHPQHSWQLVRRQA